MEPAGPLQPAASHAGGRWLEPRDAHVSAGCFCVLIVKGRANAVRERASLADGSGHYGAKRVRHQCEPDHSTGEWDVASRRSPDSAERGVQYQSADRSVLAG